LAKISLTCNPPQVQIGNSSSRNAFGESLESFRESQHAQGDRLTRNSPGETVAPRNRSLVIDPHADRFG
jgi:hypothetical protein